MYTQKLFLFSLLILALQTKAQNSNAKEQRQQLKTIFRQDGMSIEVLYAGCFHGYSINSQLVKRRGAYQSESKHENNPRVFYHKIGRLRAMRIRWFMKRHLQFPEGGCTSSEEISIRSGVHSVSIVDATCKKHLGDKMLRLLKIKKEVEKL